MIMMTTISEQNRYEGTPTWMKEERYLYCDNFANDFSKKKHAVRTWLSRFFHITA